MIDTTLARRFVGGTILEGDEANAVMVELTTFGGWRMWVQAALESLDNGDPDEAEKLLEQILREYEE